MSKRTVVLLGIAAALLAGYFGFWGKSDRGGNGFQTTSEVASVVEGLASKGEGVISAGKELASRVADEGSQTVEAISDVVTEKTQSAVAVAGEVADRAKASAAENLPVVPPAKKGKKVLADGKSTVAALKETAGQSVDQITREMTGKSKESAAQARHIASEVQNKTGATDDQSYRVDPGNYSKASMPQVTEAPSAEAGMTERSVAKVSEAKTAAKAEIDAITSRGIEFGSNDAIITSNSELTLQKLAQFMQLYPSVEIEIAGHTDAIGDDSENMALSEERAKNGKRFLVESGIDPNRLHARGYGESRPLADNQTETGRRQNRRVVFTVR